MSTQTRARTLFWGLLVVGIAVAVGCTRRAEIQRTHDVDSVDDAAQRETAPSMETGTGGAEPSPDTRRASDTAPDTGSRLDSGRRGDASDAGGGDTAGRRDVTEPEPYETIMLEPGESKTVRLSEGEVWENKLVDASADGAGFQINASGSGWTIRDVGIKGPLPSSVGHVIRIQVNDPGGVGTIDNVYIEDAYNNFMFTHAYHEGHIEIRNSTFIDNLRDQEDILYGSPPGNPDANWGKQTGRGGTIHIDGCYGKDIGGYGWRLGSDGSKVENTVLVGQNVALANLWSRDVEFRNVDVVDANIGLRLGSHIHGDKNLEPTRTVVQDVQIDADTPVQRNEHQGEPPELVGSVGSSPDPSPPAGAPESAREAASGR